MNADKLFAMDGSQQLAGITFCVHGFFDAHLKGTGVPHLNIPTPLHPEVQVLNSDDQTHRPKMNPGGQEAWLKRLPRAPDQLRIWILGELPTQEWKAKCRTTLC